MLFRSTEADVRRLVRAYGELVVAGTEYVTGDHWLPRAVTPRSELHRHADVTLPLMLLLGNYQMPNVQLRCHLAYGSLARVELAADSTLSSLEGSLLLLRAGTNLIEVLSAATRAAILERLEQPQ